MVLNVLSDVTSSTDLFCVFKINILYVLYANYDMTYSKLRKPPSSLANSNLHTQCRFSHAVQPQNNFVKLRIMKKGVSPQLSSTNRQNSPWNAICWANLMYGKHCARKKVLPLMMIINLNKHKVLPWCLFLCNINIQFLLKYRWISMNYQPTTK